MVAGTGDSCKRQSKSVEKGFFNKTNNNSSWHLLKTLEHWNGWQPMYLPPYSPDFNPIESIWLVMKARWFNNHVCKNIDQLIHRPDQVSLDVIDNPDRAKKPLQSERYSDKCPIQLIFGSAGKEKARRFT